MLYFHLEPHIRATFFGENVITLDLLNDEYKVLSPTLSRFLDS